MNETRAEVYKVVKHICKYSDVALNQYNNGLGRIKIDHRTLHYWADTINNFVEESEAREERYDKLIKGSHEFDNYYSENWNNEP